MSDRSGMAPLRHRAITRLAAWPAVAALLDAGATARARATRAVVLAACLLLHLGLFALLASQDGPAIRTNPQRPMEIVFIERSVSAPAPPPMPRAASFRASRSLRAVTIEPPAIPLPPADVAPDLVLLPGRSLMEQIPGVVASDPAGPPIGVRDPMRPIGPRLPGGGIARVEGIRLRHRITPEDVVRSVGALFGGNYDPCPDVMGKMHDATIVNPERYSHAERRDLMQSERRCRY